MPGNFVQPHALAARTRPRFALLQPFVLPLLRHLDLNGRLELRIDIRLPDFSKAVALLAPPVRRIEGEQPRIQLLKRLPAARATHLRAQHGHTLARVEQLGRAFADFQRPQDHLAHFRGRLRFTHYHVNGMLAEAVELLEALHRHKCAVHEKLAEPLLLRPLRHVGMKTLARLDERRQHSHAALAGQAFGAFGHRRGSLFLHGHVAFWTKLRSQLGEHQPQEMINFRDRRHRRFAAAARDPLFDGHARRQSRDQVHIGLFELLDELPCIRRHRIEKSPLPFRKENVEGERRFARTAQAGDHDHLVPRDLKRDVLEIVLARAEDGDGRAKLAAPSRAAGSSATRALQSSSSIE